MVASLTGMIRSDGVPVIGNADCCFEFHRAAKPIAARNGPSRLQRIAEPKSLVAWRDATIIGPNFGGCK
jgi:hypothetical protein